MVARGPTRREQQPVESATTSEYGGAVSAVNAEPDVASSPHGAAVTTNSEALSTQPEQSSLHPSSSGPQADTTLDAAKAASKAEDEALVQAIRGGDQRAFRTLFEKYQRRAIGIAFGVVRNHDDAVEIAQEAFVKVHRSLDTFLGNSSFFTWFYRIIRNLSIDLVRRRKYASTGEFDDAQRVSDPGPMMPQQNSTMKLLVRKQISEEVAKALSTLSPNHREILVLREVEELSYEEIAELLSVPVGTVMSRLFHARKNMQGLLATVLGDGLDLEG